MICGIARTGPMADAYTAEAPSHGVVMIRIAR